MDCDWDFQLKNPGLASSELTNGVARTGQRALLYATGMDEEDMKKPFVAVINSFSEMVPGHMHMRELAEQVKYGILEGGRHPPPKPAPSPSATACARATAVCATLCPAGISSPTPSKWWCRPTTLTPWCSSPAATRSYPACSWPPPGWTSLPSWSPAAPCCPATWAGNPLFCSSELREFPGRVEQGSCTVEEMKKAEEAADAHKAVFDFVKETLGDQVKEVKASARLKSHPCA